MKGLVVLSKATNKDLSDVHPYLSKIIGIKKLIAPFKIREYNLNDIKAGLIKIPEGFEKIKINFLYRKLSKDNLILSRDFAINNDTKFFISCLVRALDIFTISQGCDLRLNEILIADAENLVGKICFQHVLSFARRIILLASKRENLQKEVEFALKNFGTSVAVLEDPIKAASSCQALILTNKKYEFLVKDNKPTLILDDVSAPNQLCFDDVEITMDYEDTFDMDFALGYVMIKEQNRIWKAAEDEGFKIAKLKLQNKLIFEL